MVSTDSRTLPCHFSLPETASVKHEAAVSAIAGQLENSGAHGSESAVLWGLITVFLQGLESRPLFTLAYQAGVTMREEN